MKKEPTKFLDQASKMNKSLFVMRHAESRTSSNYTDFERPLTENGQEIQKSMASFLKNKGLTADEIWHSPFKRTTESAHIIAREIGCQVLVQEPLLGDQFDSEFLLDKLKTAHGNSILLIGHEPSLAFLMHKFLKKTLSFKLTPSSIFQIKFENSFEWGLGILAAHYSPRDL